MKSIKLYVESELDMFRNECNFTDEELQYFNMKAKDCSDNKISIEMNISSSKVAKLSKQVRAKMKRVLELGVVVIQ